MAIGTRHWILCRRVVWICRVIVIIDMARVTIGRRACKPIVDMAAGTRRLNVGSRQREARLRVIKGCGHPRCGRMACAAIVVEVAAYVIRVCHIVEICLVAAEAIGTEALELAVLVAKTTISR